MIRFALISIAILAFIGWSDGLRINSNLLDLIPGSPHPSPIEEAAKEIEAGLANQIFWVIHHPNEQLRHRGALEVQQWIEDSSHMDLLLGKASPNEWKAYHQLLFPLRFSMPLPDSPPWTSESSDEFFNKKLKEIFSGLSPLLEFEKDPLLLFQDLVESKIRDQTRGKMNGGWIELDDGKTSWVILLASLNESAFSTSAQRAVASNWTPLKNSLKDRGYEVEATGALFFAHDQGNRIKEEVGLVGGISVVAVIGLFFLLFGSVHPLTSTLLCLVVGTLVAFGWTLMLFGEIHLITLGFGSTIIGMAVDYAFHSLCHKYSHKGREGDRSLEKSLFWAWLSTSLALLTFFLSPLPVMHQMATFLISGLLGALLCCRLFLGWRHSKTSQNNRFLSLENHPVTILPLKLPSLSPFWGLGVLALLVVFINRNLSFNDDLRSFGNPAEKMLETNRWIKKLIGKDGTWSMLIVHGNNVNQVLEHEQELLARIKEEYPDAKSQCLSEIIPSIALQERHRGNWMEAITNHREKFIQYFKKLGLPESRLDHMIDDLKVIKPQPWQTFRDLPGFRILELQMLEQSNVAYSCILLRGVQKDLLQKTLEGFDKTYLFDRVENINTLLRSYREETSKWLLLAGISTLLIQVLLLGFIRGTKVGLPPLLAIAITWAGLLIVHPEGINLFHILSSVLIWGVGLDYALMVNRNKVLEGSTILANSSSAFTSILAFGLLSLSESPVLASLGLTASIGISLVLVLSFLFRPKMHVSPS